MMLSKSAQSASVGGVALVLVCMSGAAAQVVRSAAGANAAAITAARDQYRVDLGGGTTAGANGSFGGLRREINWDGVPDAASAPNNLAANFFNSNSPRGVVFSTPGSGFQVSANSGVAPVEFDNIDPSYSADFAPFSAQRLFTALGSNVVDVNFFAPGTNTPALTRGFGSVFTDVDRANTTSIELFDASNASLGSFIVPTSIGNESLSFLGVSFPTAVISRARITNGNTALAAGVTDQQGDSRDLVVMDDFIYGEPTPEPAAVIVCALAAGGFILRRRGSTSSDRLAHGNNPLSR
jgi:hypothetical protein